MGQAGQQITFNFVGHKLPFMCWHFGRHVSAGTYYTANHVMNNTWACGMMMSKWQSKLKTQSKAWDCAITLELEVP